MSTNCKLATTTTTAVLRQLYRSTCVSSHLQLTTGGFCWCKVLLPDANADGNQRIQAREKTMEFSLTVLFTLSPYHTHPFNGPFSGTTWVSRYQKAKPIWILLKQETVSGSAISWAICKSAPRSGKITMPAPRHSVFYRPDVLPATQPTTYDKTAN